MTKEDIEQLLLMKFEDIVRAYKEYNPEGTYLTISYLDGSIVGFDGSDERLDIYKGYE